MTSGTIRALVVVLGLALQGGILVAQDRPVVFIHGLKSTGAAWEATAARLQTQLAIEAHRPTPGWKKVFQVQAGEVDASLGGLSASNVVVGHSNGGIVAREWSRNHPMSALITLGTPNRGAPLAANMLNWVHYNFAAGDAIANVYGAFANCLSHGCGWSHLLFYSDLNVILSWMRGWLDSSLPSIVSTVGVGTTAPVLAQMVPGSTFLSSLNSESNVAREQATIPGRVGIGSVAHNFYNAGAFRLAWPDAADDIDVFKDISVVILDFLAATIHSQADFDDWDAWDIASAMSSAASWLASLDQRWCETVTWVPGSGYCDYNDEVVPLWSQQLPGAPLLLEADGPVHTREIQSSDYYLYHALTNWGQIPPRGPSTGGEGGGSTGLTQNSAVRG